MSGVHRRTNHETHRPERLGPGVVLGGGVGHGARDGASVGPDGELDRCPLRVGRERQQEHPGVVVERGVDQWTQRARPEVGARGDGVDGERARRVEVGLGVGLDGGADVAALGVEQDERPVLAGGGDGPLEHRNPGAAEPFVERRLRLQHRDTVAERLDDGAGEAFEPGDVGGQTPGPQQRGVRIDPDAQWTPRLHRGVQAGAKGRHLWALGWSAEASAAALISRCA